MENLKLYRTIGFETFADLMLYGEERYVNPQQWKDTYEGYVFRLMDTEEDRRVLIKKLYEHYGKEEKVVDIFSRYYSLYHGCYAQCWTGTDESDAMWRIYSYGNHAIRISTTMNKIQKVLENNKHPDGRILKIKYDVQNEGTVIEEMLHEMTKGNSAYYGFTHKREAFSHENEYRAMFMMDAGEVMIRELRKKKYFFENTIDTNDIEEIVKRLEKSFPRASCRQQGSAILKVNIEDYIDSIMIHPFAEDWYVDRVRKLCELKEIEGKFMGKSNLYQCPNFSGRKDI